MNHDSSNPFHKLAKDFAARKNAGEEPSPRRPSPRPGKETRDSGNDAGDRALFLNAVSSIKPLAPRKEKKRSPGQLLAERMRSDDSPSAAFSGASSPAASPASLPHDKARQTSAFPPAGGPAASPAQTVRPNPPERRGPEPTPVAAASPKSDVPFASAMRDLFEAPDEDAGHEEMALFAKAMQGVAPIAARGGRDVAAPAGPDRPVPAQDPAKALRDVLEGRVEFALHHTDEFMEGYVVGVDPLVLARLRAGQYSPEKHLDMHGMNARQAHDALVWFIRDAYHRGLRCVVVVTGRGRNSPDGVGVLRPLLQRWLSREPFKRVVLAFCTARPEDGGPGAAYVLLRKYKKNRGKIVWDHTPSDDDFPGM